MLLAFLPVLKLDPLVLVEGQRQPRRESPGTVALAQPVREKLALPSRAVQASPVGVEE
jgi:hypothetical protein